jgi:hypothetical protein
VHPSVSCQDARPENAAGSHVWLVRRHDDGHRLVSNLIRSVPARLTAVEPGVFSARLRAPPDLPPRLDAGAAAIAWSLRVKIRLPLWPGWSRRVKLVARGASESRSAPDHVRFTFD